MPPVQLSRHLARQDVQVDGTSYACLLCLTMIDVTMRGATLTPCCSRRIHRTCYDHHVATSDNCGHCRAPFAASAAISDDVTNKERQRQQAIRDLEALLEPGAIEDRITQVGQTLVSNIYLGQYGMY